MGKRYLLDSNTVIDYIGGLLPEKGKRMIDHIVDDKINVSVITEIEVLSYGPDKDDNYPILLDFFNSAHIFELTREIVVLSIQLRQKHKIKLPDAVIASTALAGGMVLVTRNVKDFNLINGLDVINPYEQV